MMLTILVIFLCSFKQEFLTTCVTGLSNGMMVLNSEMEEVWKETGVSHFSVLALQLSRGA
jgi:hypothetical protein